MSIKEIVFLAVKDVKIGETFTLGDLLSRLADNDRYTDGGTTKRRLRELRKEGIINYKALGHCKYKLLRIDNNGVGRVTITHKTSRMGERVNQSANTAYSASSPVAFDKGKLF